MIIEVEQDKRDHRRQLHVGCGGGVTLRDGRPCCHRCGGVDDNAGWKRKVLMWNWHQITLAEWPGWDLIGFRPEWHPPFVELTIVNGKDKPSRDIANEWDDLATGLFYCRDWSLDGSVSVCDGETYRAGFWFERVADRDAFLAKYGGVAK